MRNQILITVNTESDKYDKVVIKGDDDTRINSVSPKIKKHKSDKSRDYSSNIDLRHRNAPRRYTMRGDLYGRFIQMGNVYSNNFT